MTDDFEDNGPESDPYCAHWLSIFDADHIADAVLCENCGKPCLEHAILDGAWCPDTPTGTTASETNHFKNADWPAGEFSPKVGTRKRS